jgi:hypothetical protein
MSMTFDLSPDAVTRLEAEASRLGATVETLVAEFAQSFPVEDPLDAFIGSGASGRGDLSRRHRKIRVEKTLGLTARDS